MRGWDWCLNDYGMNGGKSKNKKESKVLTFGRIEGVARSVA